MAEAQARRGTRGILVRPGQGQGWPLPGPSEARFERGNPACGVYMRGAESGGAFSFGSFLWASKERNPSYGAETPLIIKSSACVIEPGVGRRDLSQSGHSSGNNTPDVRPDSI